MPIAASAASSSGSSASPAVTHAGKKGYLPCQEFPANDKQCLTYLSQPRAQLQECQATDANQILPVIWLPACLEIWQPRKLRISVVTYGGHPPARYPLPSRGSPHLRLEDTRSGGRSSPSNIDDGIDHLL